MKRFRYKGVIPASKSHFNRALICASHVQAPASPVVLHGQSRCDDVVKMQTAVARLASEKTFDCGAAGTVLRFLALRVSRLPGEHLLLGSPRLLARPQEDLREVFDQLSIQTEMRSDALLIKGDGWKLKEPSLKVKREKSSQFVSGVLLNAWNLDFPLHIEWDQPGVSEGYWQLTVQVVRDFGMTVEEQPTGIVVPARARVNIDEYEIESDISSAFAIAAYASLNGEAVLEKFPFATLQPDVVFVDILEKMGARVVREKDLVRIAKPESGRLQGIHWNLKECPDLFPVLATLCAFAKGPSRLDGAPHLIFKESNRIEKTAELLKHLGVGTKILADGMEIHPPEALSALQAGFDYDTDHDHRLAFAASLVRSQNYPIRILHPDVVNKSFPEFWDILSTSTQE